VTNIAEKVGTDASDPERPASVRGHVPGESSMWFFVIGVTGLVEQPRGGSLGRGVVVIDHEVGAADERDGQRAADPESLLGEFERDARDEGTGAEAEH